MNANKTGALRDVLERGVGARVVVRTDSSGLRAGLSSFFDDLGPNGGPLFTLAPSGLRRHRVSVRFGRFARQCIEQIQAADAERLSVARALVDEAAARGELTLEPTQPRESWTVTGPAFGLDVLVRDVVDPGSEEAVIATASRVMVPLMAAFAELNGYDEAEPEEYDTEGRITESVVHRRERSPRNRLLCLSIHGHRCAACGFVPSGTYGEAGGIIEVHHLEPVANLTAPRPYDPRTDLVPLCPNCHRAVHTRRSVPLSLDELREAMRHAAD